MVVTISPSFNLYKMVVFPAASRPTIRIRISFFPHILSNNLEKVRPMLAAVRTGRLKAVALGKARSAQTATDGGWLCLRYPGRDTERQDQRSDLGKRDGRGLRGVEDGLDLTVKGLWGVRVPPSTDRPGDGSGVGAGGNEALLTRKTKQKVSERWQSVDADGGEMRL